MSHNVGNISVINGLLFNYNKNNRMYFCDTIMLIKTSLFMKSDFINNYENAIIQKHKNKCGMCGIYFNENTSVVCKDCITCVKRINNNNPLGHILISFENEIVKFPIFSYSDCCILTCQSMIVSIFTIANFALFKGCIYDYIYASYDKKYSILTRLYNC